MLKWILRRTTGKCELERICSSYPAGAERTRAVEYSLSKSKLAALKILLVSDGLNASDAANNIITLKGVDITRNEGFRPALLQCLRHISGYQKLVSEVTRLQKEKYSTAIDDHEQQLLKLWSLLKPARSRKTSKTKRVGELGFQGNDPATDFRGMGLLGLQNLVFFAENYNRSARKVLSESFHPKFGYSFAVVGINLTSLILELLCKEQLKSHFYNSVSGEPSLYHFHRVYCHVFCEFHDFWFAEEPESVMEFSRILELYKVHLLSRLTTPGMRLHSEFLAD
ncbi:putative ELMO domain-containing protein 2 [Apostichopus japonicus]|uniref:Putative ELMO domain-containing protein 2 n=1 Tax=Stichopus japonicus TaxID=307972 RepID=A0A2G8KAC1_STIJA|nr:putative ELMO domain-containing protein 2 [Apostichopus japonicus]